MMSLEKLTTTGIKGVKHHYSTNLKKSCIIKISSDSKYFIWEYHDLIHRQLPDIRKCKLREI